MKRFSKQLKKMTVLAGGLLILGILSICLCNQWVLRSTEANVYSSIDKIPENKIGLVLGTNRLIKGKYRNPYFDHRIKAAYDLYKNGKVKHLILSGDNSRSSYSEPEDMKTALLALGVPESAITLDFAGFRTLDSVVRAHAIFQQKQFTIISQKFHNHRALFIANNKQLKAIAFSATDPFETVTSKTLLREYLARCKAVLDLYILRKSPKFFGEKIDIKV